MNSSDCGVTIIASSRLEKQHDSCRRQCGQTVPRLERRSSEVSPLLDQTVGDSVAERWRSEPGPRNVTSLARWNNPKICRRFSRERLCNRFRK